jgi:hypothetical protein
MRFERALKPWALAQPAVSVVTFVVQLVTIALNFALSSAFGRQALPLTPPYEPQVVIGVVFLGLVAAALGIGEVIYSIALLVQSGSVGSGLRRWPVFGIALLANVAVGLVFGIVDGIVTAGTLALTGR